MGFRSKISFMANLTQSAGVPEQLYSIILILSDFIFLQCSIEFIVIACPIADRGESDYNKTSPISLITFISARSPGALIPSSFVTRMSGFYS